MVYRKNALLAVVSYAVACSCSSPAVTNQSGGHLTQTDKAAIEWFDTLGFPDLSNCELSDPSPLAELTSLRGLDLTGTRLSEADVRKMQQKLPNCYIIGP